MHNKITLCNMTIPAYGTIVIMGIMVVTMIGIIISWNRKLSIATFFKLEFIGGISALLGAKLWYMITNCYTYGEEGISFRAFIDSGYSFYGGMIFGLVAVYMAAKLMNINFISYSRHLICLVPLLHAFWKIGCFMGGCCYGIRYEGIGAVVFPEGVKAPAGIPLFPVQLVEAVLLVIMAFVFFIRGIYKWNEPVRQYLCCYAGVRFFLEYFRYHRENNFLSTAQWVSIGIFIIVVASFIIKKKEIEYQ